MQIIKIGKPEFFSNEQPGSADELKLLLKGNLQIPITIEIHDDSKVGDVPNPEEQTLYDQIGGEKTINDAVDIFYRKVMNDQRIFRFFHYTDLSKQRLKQKVFLSFAFGGPDQYTGKSMRDAHALFVKMGLDDSHFDAVLDHLRTTFEELNIPNHLIAKALTIAESVRDDVLGR